MLQRSQPSTARRVADRDRQRRYRERRRKGQAGYYVNADDRVLDLLVKLHWIADADAGDPRKVGAALSALLADAAK